MMIFLMNILIKSPKNHVKNQPGDSKYDRRTDSLKNSKWIINSLKPINKLADMSISQANRY